MNARLTDNKNSIIDDAAKQKKIEKFRSFLEKAWKGSKPLAKLFKTESKFYIYDTGTNKIMSCEPIIHALLERLFSMEIQEAVSDFLSNHHWDEFIYASGSIKAVMEFQKVLLTTKVEKFGAFDTFEEYEALILSSMEILCLETADICNMRCFYCVYSDHVPFKRSHGNRTMEWDVAQKAIDYLKGHSFDSKKIAISFYGGEPLANFPLIERGVVYARSILDKKPLSFSMSTNGTLLTPEIVRFLYNNDFQVLVSIDGPKEIHDRYRKDLEGKGTFERVTKGLRLLIDVYGDSVKDKIQLNMVYTPPWSGQKLDRVTKLWEEIPWLPKEIKVNITYPVPGSILWGKFSPYQVDEDKNLLQWSFEKFRDRLSENGESNPMANYVVERRIAGLMQRPVYQDPLDRYSLNGCCIPGVRKLFVTVDGIFHLCERIHSDSPPIGNVRDGIDLGVIKKIYIDGYREAITPTCSGCWAVGLCTSCYLDVFVGGKIDVSARENYCMINKHTLDQLLAYYCSSMESDPKKLNYLYDFELT